MASLFFCLAGCQPHPQFIPALDDDPIKPGDVLLVRCSGIPIAESAPVKWVVDDAGYLKLPYARPWRAAGKRPSELARELSKYFSVRRSVTFTVEKFGSAFSADTPAAPVAR